MENLKIFYSKVLDDVNLSTQLNQIINEVETKGEITDEDIQKVIALAKTVDVELTAEEIENYLESLTAESEKLTDNELEMVAGGKKKSAKETAQDIRDNLEPVVNTLDWLKKLHVHCFAADSKISTPNGAKVISEIKVGDEVFSLDAQNKKVVGKVIEVRPIADEEIYKVEFSNGATWLTTSSQYFYCGNDDYACAIDSKGKAALTEDGATATVAKVTKTGEVKKVYDFIVDGVNVFFVEGIASEGYSED